MKNQTFRQKGGDISPFFHSMINPFRYINSRALINEFKDDSGEPILKKDAFHNNINGKTNSFTNDHKFKIAKTLVKPIIEIFAFLGVDLVNDNFIKETYIEEVSQDQNFKGKINFLLSGEKKDFKWWEKNYDKEVSDIP